jgi:hypothetical protein
MLSQQDSNAALQERRGAAADALSVFSHLEGDRTTCSRDQSR